jgi:hypothetical protein
MGQRANSNKGEDAQMMDVDVPCATQQHGMCDDAPAGPSQGSPVAECASAPGAAERRPEELAEAHTLATESGGISMLEQIAAMKEDAAKQEHLVKLISELLEETVARNDSLGRKTVLAAFEGDKAPVRAGAYVRRIAKYGGCSACCFAIGLIYLKRLKRRENSVCLTSCNFQRLFLVAVMLAAKFLDDSYYSNKHWAEVGGMTTAELNCLELEFLFRLGFSLALSREEYDHYVRLLAGEESASPAIARTQSASKGDGMGDKTPSFTDVAAAATAF